MLGGGQLGRMWVHAAQSMGYRCMVLDPDPLSPAGAAADRHLQADYLDAAALQTLDKLGLLDALRPRFVVGENIGQAFQFVKTGNAALGFVALSQVKEGGRVSFGSAWVVPAQLHAPIRQDAVLLKLGKDNAAAKALLQYLRSHTAQEVMRGYGYQF